MKCGCSEIAEASIEEWEKKYKDRYGHNYIEKNTNPEYSRIRNLSMSDLKQELYNNPDCMNIIRYMYPEFPRYLSLIDSVLLFFDKICKDGRIGELRSNLAASNQIQVTNN